MICPVMQFGTSRFLQAHVDLFVSEAMGQGQAAGPIAVVQTTNSPDSRRRIQGFRAMRPYPVLIRGMAQGVVVDRRVEVGSVAEAFHAVDDGPEIERRFVAETRFVVCNTGDNGWRLDGATSFPALLLRLLHARFVAGAEPLVLLPCELVSGNGTALRSLVAGLARAHNYGPAFGDWLEHRCVWVNSLVDRIVSEALEPVGAVAEPYALWAIAAAPRVEAPCIHPDMHIVADLLPYERLKLFILNLGHSVLAERWLAERHAPGLTVAEAMTHPGLRAALDDVYDREVLPVFGALGMAGQAMAYRQTAVDRFANPFLRHRLADIATNHTTKKQRRITPLLSLARLAGLPPARQLSAIETSGVG